MAVKPKCLSTSQVTAQDWMQADASGANWYSLASSADGTKLVAANLWDSIYTSTDSGVSWTPRESSRNWFSVASSADGSKLVALDENGQIYTSDSTTTSGTAGSLIGAQYAAIELQYIGNGLFLQISRVGTITGF